ncbi:hypothetical protein [Agromyces aureus]|uniref:hypothetical protein n=1 Tax=Agromyces aureus TaxID=453304 RepID=UPI001D12EFDC|nr:hypothetical protein [Agromyces aureus]
MTGATSSGPQPAVVVMGVAGSGKSTLAAAIAERLGAVGLEMAADQDVYRPALLVNAAFPFIGANGALRVACSCVVGSSRSISGELDKVGAAAIGNRSVTDARNGHRVARAVDRIAVPS